MLIASKFKGHCVRFVMGNLGHMRYKILIKLILQNKCIIKWWNIGMWKINQFFN